MLREGLRVLAVEVLGDFGSLRSHELGSYVFFYFFSFLNSRKLDKRTGNICPVKIFVCDRVQC